MKWLICKVIPQIERSFSCFENQTKYGKTPLACAVFNNSRPIVEILVANGANVKCRVSCLAKQAYEPEDGRTTPLLHLALCREITNFEIFRALADSLAFSDFFERNSVSSLTKEANNNKVPVTFVTQKSDFLKLNAPFSKSVIDHW